VPRRRGRGGRRLDELLLVDLAGVDRENELLYRRQKEALRWLELVAKETVSPFPPEPGVELTTADGPEFDWYAIAAAQVEIALDFKMGGRVISMRGDIRSVKSSSQAEGTPNGIDFEYSATILAIA